MDWLGEKWGLLLIVADFLMVAIWMVYLHLLLLEHRRRNRPRVVIHGTNGRNLGAYCLMANLSDQIIHVDCVVARVQTRQGEFIQEITDYDRLKDDDYVESVVRKLRQGPLPPGGSFVLGSFQKLLSGRWHSTDPEAGPQMNGVRPEDVERLEIRAVFIHGPTVRPVGAYRSFRLESTSEGKRLVRENETTEHLAGRRKRHEVLRWLDLCTNA